MVRSLQKKFIKTAMLAISLLILVMFIAINIFNFFYTSNQMHETMDLLIKYDGQRDKIGQMTHVDIPGARDMGTFEESSASDLSEESTQTAEAAETTGDAETTKASEAAKNADGKTKASDSDKPSLPEDHSAPADEEDNDNSFVEDFMGGKSTFSRTDEDTFITTAFFTVIFDSDGNSKYINAEQFSSLSDDEAVQIAEEVCSTGNTEGFIGVYMYSVVENEKSGDQTVIIMDTTDERFSMLRILIVSICTAAIAWAVMLALVIFLSKKAINPIASNIEKQKQFVTNAGHELKTPLAIIQSNTEAMELFNGENKWSKNIKGQVTRLSELTQNLLTLSRMDESADSMVIENIDLSTIASEDFKTFSGPFNQKDIQISSDIQENVNYKGDKGQLTQLFSLLFDNALKYTNEGGKFSISLTKKGSKITLNMTNTCEELPTCPPDKLFDRFYRSDESHSQKKSGQGIGLSVVASIVGNHNGTVTAVYHEEDTSISFIIKL